VFDASFALFGLIYLVLPMNKILSFFHEEKFLEVQQQYESVRDSFTLTYQNLNPIYTLRPLYNNHARLID